MRKTSRCHRFNSSSDLRSLFDFWLGWSERCSHHVISYPQKAPDLMLATTQFAIQIKDNFRELLSFEKARLLSRHVA
jgi:hypothetical protein